MSRPSGIAQVAPGHTRTGIVLAVSPTSDPTHQLQIQRANGSSTGTFTTIATLAGQVGPGQYPTFVDVLPNDGGVRCYRARAYKQGYTQSTAFTSIVSARPAIIPDGLTVQTPISGHKIGSNISLSTAQKLQLGSGNVAATITKTALFPSAFFLPATQTTKYHYSSAGYLYPNTTTGTQTYVAPVFLPIGTVLGNISLWGQQAHTGSVVKAVFTETDFTETSVNHCTLTLTTTIGDTATSSGANGMTITAGHRYNWTLTLRSTAAATDAKMKLISMDYRMPDYARAL